MTSKPERIERLRVAIPLEELKAIEDFRFRHRMPNRTAAVRELLRRGLAASEKPTRQIKKSKKIRNLKIFTVSDFVPLESEYALPTSPAVERPNWARQSGRRRVSGALLIPMLLNGGCGYEDNEPRPLLADEHWL
jgi:hypothetical protein